MLFLFCRLKEYVRSFTIQESVKEAHLSIVARFLLAVPDLCPTLQKCLSHSIDNKVNTYETLFLFSY